jgi:hypothetical protein
MVTVPYSITRHLLAFLQTHFSEASSDVFEINPADNRFFAAMLYVIACVALVCPMALLVLKAPVTY